MRNSLGTLRSKNLKYLKTILKDRTNFQLLIEKVYDRGLETTRPYKIPLIPAVRNETSSGAARF